jgi:hypothetical protein
MQLFRKILNIFRKDPLDMDYLSYMKHCNPDVDFVVTSNDVDWLDIVGESFYEDNINIFPNASFHDALLIEHIYKEEWAVKVVVHGRQVGSIKREYLDICSDFIKINGNKIRVLIHNDTYPNVKMCKFKG